jgi:hypothetical protein
VNADRHTTPTDRVLQAVVEKRRRIVLRYLVEGDNRTLEVSELARRIARDDPAIGGEDFAPRAIDPGADAAAECWDPVEAITIQLHHVHLPQLATSGLIDYDACSETVRYRSHDGAEELLQFISERLE